MTTERIQPWRRRVHLLLLSLIVGLPFLRVGGESAFRFDVPALRLHFFGTAVPMDEFFLVLLAVLFLTFLFLWVTVAFGRIWCGWLCPQLLLVELAAGRDGAMGGRPAAQVRVLLLSALTGVVSVWYFVSPYDFIPDLLAGNLGKVAAGSWIVVSLLAWLDLTLVRHSFCATVCPYAKLQGVLCDDDSLVIAYDKGREEDCIDCGACVKVCPVGIDIREGLQAACVGCAGCVDACARVLGRKGNPSLVGYFFGGPGGKFRPWRPASALTGLAAILFAVLLLAAAFSRPALEVAVLPDPRVAPRRSMSGQIVNAYLLSVENRSGREAEFGLEVSSPAGPVDISPERIVVPAGGHRRLTVLVAGDREGEVNVTLDREGRRAGEGRTFLLAPE